MCLYMSLFFVYVGVCLCMFMYVCVCLFVCPFVCFSVCGCMCVCVCVCLGFYIYKTKCTKMNIIGSTYFNEKFCDTVLVDSSCILSPNALSKRDSNARDLLLPHHLCFVMLHQLANFRENNEVQTKYLRQKHVDAQRRTKEAESNFGEVKIKLEKLKQEEGQRVVDRQELIKKKVHT